MKTITDLKLCIYESLLDNSIKNRLITILENSNDLKNLQKELDNLKKEYEDLESKLDELDKAYNYKEAISSLSTLINKAKSLSSRLPDDENNVRDNLNKLIKVCETKIKKFKTKNVKKKLNNKYYLDYTKKHNEAFRETEKEIRGYNTKAGMNHDMDKWIMYHFLPAPIAQTLHTQFSKHHKKRAKSKEDYLQMIIDIECGRKTKPDKQLKPYQVIDKFYPELKSTMIPILKEYGLPTNDDEARKMEKEKKK